MSRQSILATILMLWAVPLLAQNAADAYYDPARMAAARSALNESHGEQIHSMVFLERFEYQSNDGNPLTVWEGQAWIGHDLNKFWFKTEGEYEADENRFSEVELQALYSHAISPFWDLQAGVRHDIKPNPSRNYAVLGIQGLAPHWFEIDSALFLSDEGDLSARIEAEYEFQLTQRLVLQPRLELNMAFSDDPEIGMGSGLSEADFGLRLRYEVRREFAPYVGVSWIETFGKTRDYHLAEGESTGEFSWVAGLRFWF